VVFLPRENLEEENMKIKILIAALILSLSPMAFADNYILTIDGDSYEISLDKEMQLKIGNKPVAVKLQQKEILTYKTDSFSFEHARQYTPSTTNLGDGVYQTVMMTPLGSVIMIQEYQTMNPKSLIDIMINEVTKEERDYGYKIESFKKSIKLSDGKILNGKVVTSKYRGSDIKRYFCTYGIKDAGLFIMTQIDYESEPSAESAIERVINSLKVTMN
jgi:hypothetical protein